MPLPSAHDGAGEQKVCDTLWRAVPGSGSAWRCRAELLEYPLTEIDKPPTHDAVNRRDRFAIPPRGPVMIPASARSRRACRPSFVFLAKTRSCGAPKSDRIGMGMANLLLFAALNQIAADLE